MKLLALIINRVIPGSFALLLLNISINCGTTVTTINIMAAIANTNITAGYTIADIICFLVFSISV